MKYLFKVCYDGTGYFGFQRQPKHKTVQGELEKALGRIFNDDIRLSYAGRTDAGVHGLGQVAAFEHPEELPARAIVEGANSRLEPSVVVTEAATLAGETDFHPRYSALSRTYEYRLLSGAGPRERVLWADRAWCLGGELDLELMKEGASLLLGEHDFRTFTARCDRPHYRREVLAVEIKEQPWLSGQSVTVTITANAFLRRMVRLLVGALVEIGLGESSCGRLLQRLQARDPDRAPHPAPPSGLYFHSACYRPDPFCSDLAGDFYRARAQSGVRIKGR